MATTEFPTYSIGDAADMLQQIIEFNLNECLRNRPVKQRMVPILIGSPGIAKSAVVEDMPNRVDRDLCAAVAEQQNHPSSNLIVNEVRLADHDVTSFSGLMWKRDGSDTMYRTDPEHLFLRGQAPGPSILFLDEAPQADPDTMNVLGQLLHGFQAGPHHLCPATSPILAGNAREHRSNANELPRHVWDRVILIKVRSDLNQWLNWAVPAGLNEKVIFFLAHNSTWFDKFDATSEEVKSPTPRGWHRISDAENAGVFSGLQMRMLVDGTVGSAAASQYRKYLELRDKFVDPRTILADPQNAPLPRDIEACYAVMSSLCEQVTTKTMDAFAIYTKRIEDEMDQGIETTAFACKFLRKKDETIFMSSQGGRELMIRHHSVMNAPF